MTFGFTTTCIAFASSIAFASEDVLLDEGVSLLQMRAQPHHHQETEYFLGPKGTDCAPGEDLTLAQCLDAQKVIPNGMQAYVVVNNQRSAASLQAACFQVGPNGQILFSDEPLGGSSDPARGICKPICSKNGGRAAEIVRQGISCQEPTCKQPAGFHLMTWDDSVILPELEVLDAGATCDACGILSYEQCSKANDMGLLDELAGYKMKHEISIQVSGAGRSRPATPSGCSLRQGKASFSPYDTPDGALAGLVSDSGVGVGYNLAKPVCGVCTTTTTLSPEDDPIESDEAAAVADPHVSYGSKKADLCCEGKGSKQVCKLC